MSDGSASAFQVRALRLIVLGSAAGEPPSLIEIHRASGYRAGGSSTFSQVGQARSIVRRLAARGWVTYETGVARSVRATPRGVAVLAELCDRGELPQSAPMLRAEIALMEMEIGELMARRRRAMALLGEGVEPVTRGRARGRRTTTA